MTIGARSGLEFLVRGALEFGEPGVRVAFEESDADLSANVASLGFDLDRMQADGQHVVDSVRIDPRRRITAPGLLIHFAKAWSR